MMRMTNRPAAKTFLIQASKYALVGLGNTLLTFVVYFLLTEIFALSPGLANPIGYAVGLVNSFVWNRRWTFGHSGAWIGSAVRFLAVFAVCFAVQYALCNYLDSRLPWVKHYYNFIIAMIVYNVLFFLANKYIIFKSGNE